MVYAFLYASSNGNKSDVHPSDLPLLVIPWNTPTLSTFVKNLHTSWVVAGIDFKL